MGTAFTLTPEKLAFIAGDENPSPSQVPSQIQEAGVQVSQGDSEATLREPLRRQPKISREVRRDNATEPDSLLGMVLVPLTTRLHPRTAEGLRRAWPEQRLLCRRPATQQDIVELAVRAWLNSNGYLQTGAM